jgi:long-subunit fatty acid transport protein
MTMLRKHTLRRLVTAACAGSLLASVAPHASASNPLEYPDNGASAFSRGGAWLATATDPLAAHYNPAAMATQSSGFELGLLFAYQDVCFARKNPGNQDVGPIQRRSPDPGESPRYAAVCNQTTTQPRIIPSLGIVWRATDALALGFAVVPPATYGSTPGEWPIMAEARLRDGTRVQAPAPYRYMTVGNRSTILHPTFSAGYDLGSGLRVGAGFIWSVGVIDVESFGVRTTFPDQVGDDADLDSKSRLRTQDLFVPGAVVAVHWSLTDNLDIAAWGRWIDAIDTSEGDLDLLSQPFNANADGLAPICPNPDGAGCTGQAVPDDFSDDPGYFKQFRFVATPPEVRIGVRFHVPHGATAPKLQVPERATRDPLRDDLFDVELNGSWTMNSVADTITVRFAGNADGTASVPVKPLGVLPPRADRPTGYKDSYGARLGGQYNLVANTFGIRAGTWFETAAADAEYLNVAPVPAARGGFGGGIVFRHGALDVSLGYQRHWSNGLDNKGNGKIRAGAGTRQEGIPFKLGNEPDEEQFRTNQAINGGRVTQSANVFAAGAVYRF